MFRTITRSIHHLQYSNHSIFEPKAKIKKKKKKKTEKKKKEKNQSISKRLQEKGLFLTPVVNL